jgi:hydrogenase/urease accessory protein HupE
LGKILDTALCAVTAVIPGYAQGMQFETGNGQLSLVMGGVVAQQAQPLAPTGFTRFTLYSKRTRVSFSIMCGI